MKYEFQHGETGRLVELEMHPNEVPPIGGTVIVDGREYVRVPSLPATSMVRRNVAFVSNQLERVWSGEGPDPAPRRDAKGRPVFHTRREAIQYGLATGQPYDEL